MISPTSQPSLFQSSSPSRTPRTSLGKDEFLTLLVTQLRNQDPMSPLQPQEFAAQLAQFSSVEQLTQLNTAMSTQEQDNQVMAALTQTQFGAGLIGKNVLAETDQIEIPATGAAKLPIDTSFAGKGTLTLTDDNGMVVKTVDLGDLQSGRQTLTLPADLPAGTYHMKVEVDVKGEQKTAATYVLGPVGAVHFGNGQITLRIGKLDLALGSLVEIQPGDPGTTP